MDEELLKREVIAAAVRKRAEALSGAVELKELADFPLPDGSTRRLIDPGGGGIWNPTDFSATLSITTSPDGPYADRELAGGLYVYSYQRGPEGGKNTKMRRAYERKLPILRLHKVRPNFYVPIYPVYVVDDNPIAREFTLSLDEAIRVIPGGMVSVIEKAYVERLIRQRVHQPAFRAQVLLAYDSQCAICTLKHPDLLDAAHIIEDRDEAGLPEVTNGISLCKIHHAAFDRLLVGISPQYEVHVNNKLLQEVNGPMLRHGLQEMHGRTLTVPKSRRELPDRTALGDRFQRFLAG